MAEQPRDTRERLLEAAQRLFARQGYDAVSIRDIAATAGVNVAAINYHFQGKENLYCEVLRHVVGDKRERYVAALDAVRAERPGDLAAVVSGFFRAHFEDTLKTEDGGDFLRLIVREMHHGTPERADLMANLLIPLWAEVGAALLAAVPDVDPDLGPWLVGSLHGQLVHFTMRWLEMSGPDGSCDHDFRNTMARVFPPLVADVDAYIDRAVAHITRFSVAGVEAVLAAHRDPDPEGGAA